MKGNQKSTDENKPDRWPPNWLDTSALELLNIAQTLPCWSKLTENAKVDKKGQLRRIDPTAAAALIEGLKAQVTYWRKRAKDDAKVLNDPPVQWLVRSRQLEELAKLIPKYWVKKRVYGKRSEWDGGMISLHENWLDDWQRQVDLSEALCYNNQQLWKLTCKFTTKQKHKKGREILVHRSGPRRFAGPIRRPTPQPARFWLLSRSLKQCGPVLPLAPPPPPRARFLRPLERLSQEIDNTRACLLCLH